MNSKPFHAILSPFFESYPHLSGCLCQVYSDLHYAQQWKDLEIIELRCRRIALTGERPSTKSRYLVVPCDLSESLSLDWLAAVFTSVGDIAEIHLAIVNDDSSVVYYRISKGMVKPSS